MYFGGTPWCLLALLALTAGERWRWPEHARSTDTSGKQSVRIDTKVRFVDAEDAGKNNHNSNVQSDDVPFEQPTDTVGFYNRPPGSGRYPVRVSTQRAPYRVDGNSVYPVTTYKPPYDSDGTLDSLQYCKCVSTPECNPRPDPAHACGSGQYLCCFKRPNKQSQQNTEYFNEIEDERPMRLPGHQTGGGPFPARPAVDYDGVFAHNLDGTGNGPLPFRPDVLIGPEQAGQRPVLVGPNGPTGHIGPSRNPDVLVGPNGPTGHIGPGRNPDVLVGPNGPTGHIGPGRNPDVLVGPNGPTGHIGPERNPDVLVGPNGPTGVIGPAYNQYNRPDGSRDTGFDGSAQRGVLVGPGGPTGIIGPYRQQPYRQQQRPVLVGPGGPTGIIGPNRGNYRGVLTGPGGPTGIIGSGYGRQSRPGLLVGPGGPTGTIGPGRQLLVGPGGPTGQIGPQYFGN